MISVASSNLSAVGYDGSALYVRFINGETYKYPGVPKSLYDGLMSAGSKGHYFRVHIRTTYKGFRV